MQTSPESRWHAMLPAPSAYLLLGRQVAVLMPHVRYLSTPLSLHAQDRDAGQMATVESCQENVTAERELIYPLASLHQGKQKLKGT